ncbi:hypothetical protein E2562_015854 [Oryza meyeriana var. granulata]|uniref:Uncharacterized protein n=1 Tax=Oryza meyeriana var. granulata TaxID=110450 RepID=A0A6G1D3Q7_9ORYZ|nr:hypothetical protein E2562_015854 [Oryza meyeriana var. granulata]
MESSAVPLLTGRGRRAARRGALWYGGVRSDPSRALAGGASRRQMDGVGEVAGSGRRGTADRGVEPAV